MEDILRCSESLEFDATDDDSNTKGRLNENNHNVLKNYNIVLSATKEENEISALHNGSLQSLNAEIGEVDKPDQNEGVMKEDATVEDTVDITDAIQQMESVLKESLLDWKVGVDPDTEESDAASAAADLMQAADEMDVNNDDEVNDIKPVSVVAVEEVNGSDKYNADVLAKYDVDEQSVEAKLALGEEDVKADGVNSTGFDGFEGDDSGEIPTLIDMQIQNEEEHIDDKSEVEDGEDIVKEEGISSMENDIENDESSQDDNKDNGNTDETSSYPVIGGMVESLAGSSMNNASQDDQPPPQDDGEMELQKHATPVPVNLICVDNTVVKQEPLDDDGLYQCNLCQLYFMESQALEAHQLVVHMTGEANYECTVCHEQFDCQSDLLLHRHEDDEEEEEDVDVENVTEPQVKLEPESSSDFDEQSEEDQTDEEDIPVTPKKRVFKSRRGKIRRKKREITVKKYKAGIRPPEGKFQCLYCKKKFHSRCHVKTHERTHTKERPCKCMHCPKTFSDPSCLTRHVRRIHHTEPVWHCLLCLKRQYTYTEYVTHKEKSHNDQLYRCFKCSVKFEGEQDLSTHGLECIGDPATEVPPNFKGKKTTNIDKTPPSVSSSDSSTLQRSPGQLRVKLHRLAIPESEKNKVALTFPDPDEDQVAKEPCKCRYCPSAFSNPYTLFQHLLATHKDQMPLDSQSESESSQPQEQPPSQESPPSQECPPSQEHPPSQELSTIEKALLTVYCRRCSAVYDDVTDLIQHEELTHNLYGPSLGCYKCPICFKRFTRRPHVRKHMKRAICGAKSSPSLSEIHVASSFRVSLVCQHCPKTFGSQGVLEEHEKTCQDVNAKGDLFKCIFCDHHFLKVDHRDKHIEHEHNDKIGYRCDECPELYSAEVTLMNHKAAKHFAVSGRPFKCPDCSSDFKTYSNMEKHRKLHMESNTGRKWKCPHCLVAFKANNHLKRHIQGVHRDKLDTPPSGVTPTETLADDVTEDVATSTESTDQVVIKTEYQSSDDGDDQTISGIRYKCGTCQSFSTTDEKELRVHLEAHGIPNTHDTADDSQSRTNNESGKDATTGGQKTQRVRVSPLNSEKPFKCLVCYRTYISRRKLRRHQKSHTGERSSRCPFCHNSFCDKYSMAKHLGTCPMKNAPELDEISGDEPDGEADHASVQDAEEDTELIAVPRTSSSLQCRYCSKVFKSSPYVRIHERMHEGIKPYKCHFCSSAYSDGAALNKHLRVNHGIPNQTVALEKLRNGEPVMTKKTKPRKQERPYQCKKCLKYMETANTLQQHRCQIQHKCMFCVKKYADAPSLNRHLRVKHGIQNRSAAASILNVNFKDIAESSNTELKELPPGPFKCKCRKSFSSEEQLVVHKETHKCRTCKKWFTKKAELWNHEKSHYIKCDVCQKEFQYHYLLERHSKTHFRCGVCYNSFLSQSELDRHKKSHVVIVNSGGENVKCTQCKAVFSEALELNHHNRTVHRDTYIPRKICRFCSKSFACTFHVIIHERTHTGEKPHKCPKCNTEFGDPSCLSRHLKKQHNILVNRTRTSYAYRNFSKMSNTRKRKRGKDSEDDEYHPRVKIPTTRAVNSKDQNINQSNSIAEFESPERKQCRLCGQKFRKTYDRIRHEQNIHKEEMHLLEQDKKDGGEEARTDGAGVQVEQNEENSPAPSDDDDNDWQPKVSRSDKEEDEKMLVDDVVKNAADDDATNPSQNAEEVTTPSEMDHKPPKSFMCKTCKFRFHSKDALVEHELTHDQSAAQEDVDDQDNRCQYCSWSFDSKAKLAEHVQLHTSIDPFKCSECQMGFASNRMLLDHKKSHTTSVSKDKSHPSEETAKQMKKLQTSTPEQVAKAPSEHVKEGKSKGKLFSCPFCSVKMGSKPKLVAHIMTHSQDEEDEEEEEEEDHGAEEKVDPSFVCQKCNKTFTSSSLLQKHNLTHTRTRVKMQKRKKTLSNLIKDEDIARYGKAFPCGRCNMKFPSEDKKIEHEKSHTEKRQVHRCNQCFRTFTQLAHLYKHKVTHADEDDFVFRCKFCIKVYGQRRSLLRHMRMFHKEVDLKDTSIPKTSHQCHVCQKAFERKWLMYAHIREFHKEVNLYKDLGLVQFKSMKSPSLTCPLCYRSFHAVSERNRHIRTAVMHRDTDLQREMVIKKKSRLQNQDKMMQVKLRKSRSHRCRICQKTFRIKRLLNWHMTTLHKGMNLKMDLQGVQNKKTSNGYTCAICKKRYTTDVLLKRHITTMHNNDPKAPKVYRTSKGQRLLTCKICNRRYTEKSTLNRHVRIIHSNLNQEQSVRKSTRSMRSLKKEANVKQEK